jgi:diketogulonate reductase-like aldo/keto reductase
MPRLGFGVYQSTAAHASVTSALEEGYRHVDSARVYRNEDEVGEAVSKWITGGGGSGEGAVWLTSKVTGKEHGTEKTDKAVDDSATIIKKHGLNWVCRYGVLLQLGRVAGQKS